MFCRRTPFPVALLAVSLLACGESREDSDLGLLSRGADALFEDLGRIVPDGKVAWGEWRRSGWFDQVETTPDGERHVRMIQRRSELSLPSGVPRDRHIKLRWWSLRKEPATAVVELNGIALGEFEVPTEPTETEVYAPKEAWQLGPNLVVLEAPPSRGGPVAVAWIEYGDERRVAIDETGMTLASGTGSRFVVEPTERAHVTIRGFTEGEGVLAVEQTRLDPQTGQSVATGSNFSFPVQAGEVERAVLLGNFESGLAQLDITWTSEDDRELRVTGIDLGGGVERRLPPVVLISIDTLASRHMSAYGYERETTPRLDEFAARSHLFLHCSANAPWTLPSYLALVTGLYPEAHRLRPRLKQRVPEVWEQWQLSENRWTLGEMLRAAGYRTAAFVDTPWLSDTFNFGQGFDHFDESANGIPRHEATGGFEHIVPRALEWIDEQPPDQPYFLFIHAVDVHAPYLPKPDVKGRFETGDEDQRLVEAGGTIFTFGTLKAYMVSDHIGDLELPGKVDVEKIISAYDEEILALDATFGSLLDGLKERGRFDETALVFTADHGESFSHGFYGHSGNLLDPIIKVPLIVKLPGQETGATHGTATQLTDVYPTLFELVTTNPPREYLHGRSLLGVMNGEESESPTVFAEGGLIKQFMVEKDGWKLIELFPAIESTPDAMLTHPLTNREWVHELFPELEGEVFTVPLKERLEKQENFNARVLELRQRMQEPLYELFHVAEDPGETENLYRDRPEIVERLMVELQRQKALGKTARETAGSVASVKAMSAEDLDALRKLGYVED